jgi:ElaB/YqjD/DUF883 family membrane-anchored ribosome-binding protein
MDSRPAGSGNGTEPVRRHEFGFEGGAFFGSHSSCERDAFPIEKRKPLKQNKNMDKETRKLSDDLGALAEDARTLMAATAGAGEQKVNEARNRLAAALDSGKVLASQAREKAVESARAADKVVRENPYQVLFIAAGVGAVIGYFLGRRHRD